MIENTQYSKVQLTQLILISLLLIALTACGNKHVEKIKAETSLTLEEQFIIKSENDDRQYKFIRLENDLEVVLVSDPTLERSAVALAVNAGSYDEKNGFWGQAHFLEHMLSLGTKKFPEVGGYSSYISKNGGVNNAYTDMDHTNYYATIKNDAYEGLLERFSDYFVSPLLLSKYIEKERNAVHSEWSMKGVYDGVILGHLNGLTLNPKHPVANFTWGNLNSLIDQNGNSLHQSTVDFFEEHYVSNRMKVAFVSNRSIAELELLADKYFKPIKKSKSNKQGIIEPAITTAQMKKIIRYKPKKNLKKIQMKFVIDNNSAEFLSKPNNYVSYLLNSEMPNTLQTSLKDSQLISNLYSWADPDAFGNAGEFVIDIDLTDQGLSKKDEIINTVFNYIKLIDTKGILPSYYQEMRKSLKNAFNYQSKFSEYNYASNLAAQMLKVPSKYLLSSHYEVTDFKPSKIRKLISQLTIDNIRVFYIDKHQETQQKMHYFDAEYAIDDVTKQQQNKWQITSTNKHLSLPRINTLFPQNFSLVKRDQSEKPILIKTKLDSKAYIKTSNAFDVPKGSITTNLNTKLGTDSAKDNVLLLMLQKIITEELSPLANEAYSAGMSIQTYQNRGITLFTSGFTDKQLELQERAFKTFSKIKLDKSKFIRSITLVETDLNNMSKDTLYSQAFAQYNTFLTLGSFTPKQLLQALAEIKLVDLKRFYSSFMHSVQFNSFVFGNFDKESISPFIENIEQTLSIVGSNEHVPIHFTQYYKFESQEQVNVKIDAQQNDVAVIDAKWQKHTVKREAIGKVLAKIVSPALFKQIRTEEQLGYSVGFYSSSKGDQIFYAWYVQTPVKSPTGMLQRFDAFKEKFTEKITLLNEKELEQYRQAVLVQLDQKAKNIYEESNEYLVDWRVGKFKFNSKCLLVEAVKQVNIDDVKQLYQQVINSNEMARVIVQIKGENFKDDSFIELEVP